MTRKTGTLWKRGYLRKNWNLRHFVLTDQKLQYYDRLGGTLKGELLFDAEATVTANPANVQGARTAQYLFELRVAALEPEAPRRRSIMASLKRPTAREERGLLMAAESEAAMREWVAAIEEVLATLRQRRQERQDVLDRRELVTSIKRGTFPAGGWPEGMSSLMAQHLTAEIFNEIKECTTTDGVTLWQCIRSGVEQLDSGVGVYAGDRESYQVFAPLFNRVIEAYHAGYSVQDRQVSSMEGLDAPNPDPAGRFILSTRIRVARNLEGTPLSPAMTRQQRVDVEQRVVEALNQMEGEEFAGTYYPLGGMEESVRARLVDDHFLFKKGDRFLESAGCNGDWPEGRGIFHNEAKTFLVWVGEEDQLRIISMQPGGDVAAVFARLGAALAQLNDRLGFSFDEHLGFIASCPSNLGTGMRASVHVRLPLGRADPRFQEILDAHHIQARGIHGEHSEMTSGVFDISNKRRLGLTEVECVMDMYNGVKALIELELEKQRTFPTFPDDSNSLLKQHLTPDVFEQLKADSTPGNGVTLYDCIRSGLENPDSGVGVYAGDEQAYSTFAALFHPIIRAYHGVDPAGNTQPSALNANFLNAPNPDLEGTYIISTRVRVARNLAGTPLSPCMTREQRLDVEQRVVWALNQMDGDEFAGTYYPLSGMEESVRARLVDDHFLFKKGDRFLESAGCNGNWPEGRGIFHNEAKTFLVWVGEEDQLRIISMQPGGDVAAVFTRLCAALAQLNDRLGFAFDRNLGFIASCPSNLGTGMRASVHVRLPLAGRSQRFQEILAEHHIQARGIHGEHSEMDGGVFDISNKRRLGLSELECVQDMYNGVKALIELEQQLGTFPTFAESNESLVKQHLTEPMFEELKARATTGGVTLYDCIRSGVENADSAVGVYAGDAESYQAFAPLFTPLIQAYHGVDVAAAEHPASDMNPAHLQGCGGSDLDPTGRFIVSSRIRAARNLAGYALTPSMTRQQRLEVERRVAEALGELEDDLAGTYYPLSGMDEATQMRLIDDHFLFHGGDKFLESAGCNRDWPEGRGIFHNEAKTFLVWVNEEDQLRVISMQPGGDVAAVFLRLSNALSALREKLGFQFDEHLGFIASCPSNLGTGMRASVHVHLPLGHADPRFQEILDAHHIQARGIHGEHTEMDGGVFDISNKRRVGLSEVQDMCDGVKALIELELEKQREFPAIPEENSSLLKQHLTPAVFDELKAITTGKGATLYQSIRSGVENADSAVGVYAGDEESYQAFAPLFDPIIAAYHGTAAAQPASTMGQALADAPALDPRGNFVLSTRIRVARNLAGTALPSATSREERLEVERRVVEALQGMDGTYYPLSDMDADTQQRLIDDHFLFKKGDRFLEAAGCNRDWPEGRGIFHNADKTFLVWVNEEDQLRVISMQPGGDVGAVFARLGAALAQLEERLGGFACDARLGFIASCPSNLGTGMRASVHVKLPRGEADPRFQEILDAHHIQARGVHGEHSEADSGVYDISNKRRLGLTEVECIMDMYNGVKALIELETRLTAPAEKSATFEQMRARKGVTGTKMLWKPVELSLMPGTLEVWKAGRSKMHSVLQLGALVACEPAPQVDNGMLVKTASERLIVKAPSAEVRDEWIEAVHHNHMQLQLSS